MKKREQKRKGFPVDTYLAGNCNFFSPILLQTHLTARFFSLLDRDLRSSVLSWEPKVLQSFNSVWASFKLICFCSLTVFLGPCWHVFLFRLIILSLQVNGPYPVHNVKYSDLGPSTASTEFLFRKRCCENYKYFSYLRPNPTVFLLSKAETPLDLVKGAAN